MLTENEIRALIVIRLQQAQDESRDEKPFIVLNQVRGMIAVLNGGHLPPFSLTASRYLIAAGIPFRETVDAKGNDTIEIPDEFLASIGCTSSVATGETFHPKFNPV